MRPVMWRTGFCIHANNNPKKPGKFWHDLIIPQGCGVVVSPCCGAERRASAAAGSGSAADAGGSRLQAVVRLGKPLSTCPPPPRAGVESPQDLIPATLIGV